MTAHASMTSGIPLVFLNLSILRLNASHIRPCIVKLFVHMHLATLYSRYDTLPVHIFRLFNTILSHGYNLVLG